jgi:hypothetical protein
LIDEAVAADGTTCAVLAETVVHPSADTSA